MLARAQREVAAGGWARRGREGVGRDPSERRLARDRHAVRGPCAVREEDRDTGCRVTPAQRRHVRLLGSVQQVAHREHAGARGAQGGVHGGATRDRIELDPGQHRQLVVGDPVGAEDDGVAGHAARAAAVEVGQLDPLDPLAAADRAHPRARPHGDPVAQPRAEPKGAQRLVGARARWSAPACERLRGRASRSPRSSRAQRRPPARAGPPGARAGRRAAAASPWS